MFNVDIAITNALKCLNEKNHPMLRPIKVGDEYVIPTLLLIESVDNRMVQLVAENDATIKEVTKNIADICGYPELFGDLAGFACDPVITNYLLVLKSTISPFSNFLNDWANGDLDLKSGNYDKSIKVYDITDDKTDDRQVLVKYINELFDAKGITKTSMADFIIFSRVKEILETTDVGDGVYSTYVEITERLIDGRKTFTCFNVNLLVEHDDDLRAHFISCIV